MHLDKRCEKLQEQISMFVVVVVQILDGKDLLNERTNTELRYLKKVLSLMLNYTLLCPTSLKLGISIRRVIPKNCHI